MKPYSIIERVQSCFSHGNSQEDILRADLTRLKSQNLDEDNEEEVRLNSESLEISFDDLEEYGDSLTPEQRKKGQYRKKPR